MRKVKFGDVVNRVNIYVDRFNTERLYYVGKGGSIEPNALDIKPQAKIEGATIGFKFHFGFNPGHILFMSRCFDQHKAATATFAGVCSDSTYVVETRDESVLMQRYLQLVMQTDDFWGWCEEHKSGGVNFLINYSTLETYEFDLPSLNEQKVLADKLWAAYRVKESYRKLLAATDDMVKAKFVEMFGGVECTTLSAISKITMGTSPDSDFYNTDGKGVPFYQGKTEFGDMYIGKAVTYCTKPVREANKDEVLMSVRAPVGAVNIAIEHCCIGRGLCSIKAKDGVAEQMFIYYALKLQEKEIENLGSGSTFKAINKDQVYNISIPICALPLQQQFVDIATQAEATKASLRQSIESIDRVIKSLINQ